MLGWLRRLLAFWRDEVRAVTTWPAGRRYYARHLLVVGAIEAVALWIIAQITPGIEVTNWGAAILGVVAIWILNAGLRPVLLYLTLPFTVLTFGLLSLVLNALMLLVAAALVPGFNVSGFGPALLAALGLAAANTFVSGLLNLGEDQSFYRNVVKLVGRRQPGRAEVPGGPGLVIVQIDGLSAPVLQFAIRTGLMPTLARWVRGGTHRVVGWECALPSQTSASQAGILHGDNFDIPAFRWFEKDVGRLIVSNHPADAARISRRVSNGHGLLSPDGSSLGNLLAGDAPRSVLTMSSLTGRVRVRSRDFFFYFLNPYNFSRGLVMMAWEVIAELLQARRQRLNDVQPRVPRGGPFPFLRAVSCVVLRDLNVALLIEDMYAGVPVIYSDFVGYDEVAHHAGPERPEALAVLSDLDAQIASLQRAAHGAPRPYEFIVLSDHGQTQGATFLQRYGLSLEGLVASLVGGEATIHAASGTDEGWGYLNVLLSELVGTGRWVARVIARLLRRRMRDGYVELGPDRSRARETPAEVVVCASGNLGLVYFTKRMQRLSREEIEEAHPGFIEGLARHEGIGFVLVRSDSDGPLAIGPDGVRHLVDDRVEGRDPLARFGRHAADHLRRLDAFPHVGDIVVNSRIDPGTGEVAAFEELVGSHGGLGGPQTHAFLLFPAGWDVEDPQLVGAPEVYAVLQRWRDRLLGTAATGVAAAAEAAAS